MFWFKNEFQKRGLKSGLPKEIRKLLNLVETTSLKKRLEISKSPKEIRKGSLKKKVRNLEMYEKKSENQGCCRKASTWWRFYLMVHVKGRKNNS